MSIRSVVLGVGLGLFIAAAAYYNDQVIYQTYFIGNHLPIIVFGTAVVLLLLASPLVGRARPAWAVTPAEVAVILALGLAVCGWPGSNLLRYLDGLVAMPAYQVQQVPSWQARDVLGYVPGHDPQRNLQGSGLLLNDGRYDDDITGPLVSGGSVARDGPAARDRSQLWAATVAAVGDVPWPAWWPTLRLWVGGAALVGVASLCLALIVHHQWTRNEQLLYPTVRFVDELSARDPGRLLPNIARDRLFWFGLAGVLAYHLYLGLGAWYPHIDSWQDQIQIRNIDLTALTTLWPDTRRVAWANFIIRPTLYPAVIAFAFFINTRVAASLGLSGFVWILVGVVFIANGEPFTNNKVAVDSFGPMARLGAYLAAAAAIAYYGRRFYLRVAGSAIGLPLRGDPVPAYAIWAARGFVLACGGFVVLMALFGGMSILVASALLGLTLLSGLVLARMNAETGLFYAQPDWLPTAALLGLLGFEGLGPAGLVAASLGSIVFMADPREAVMPYLVNALRLADRVGNVSPARIGPLIGGMVVAGLAVATIATLALQYRWGLNLRDSFSTQYLPRLTFNLAANQLATAEALGENVPQQQLSTLEQLTGMSPSRTAIAYVATGAALFAACAWARLRLPWWPIHPILFLVWGTFPGMRLSVSFLIGAIIKAAIVRLAGDRGFRATLPFMVGVIAGELTAALLWNGVGWAYYMTTGLSPLNYRVM